MRLAKSGAHDIAVMAEHDYHRIADLGQHGDPAIEECLPLPVQQRLGRAHAPGCAGRENDGGNLHASTVRSAGF